MAGLWRAGRTTEKEGGSVRVKSGGHRLAFANHLRGVAAMSVVFGHMIAGYWGPRELVAAFTATPVQLGPSSSLRRFVRPFEPLDRLAAVSLPVYVVHGLAGYSTLKFLILWVGFGHRTALVLTIATVLAFATVLYVSVERWSIRAGQRQAKRRHLIATGPEPASNAPVHLLASSCVQRT